MAEHPKKPGILGKVYSTPWLHYEPSCLGYVDNGDIYLCHRVLDQVFNLPSLDKMIKVKIFNYKKKDSVELVRLDARYFAINGVQFDLDQPAHVILTCLLNKYTRLWVRLIMEVD